MSNVRNQSLAPIVHIGLPLASSDNVFCESGRIAHNKSLHQTFNPLPIFASAKTGIASNAGELRRYVS
jgi:hypothetical protein